MSCRAYVLCYTHTIKWFYDREETNKVFSEGLWIWRLAANILNEQSRTAEKG
jgi:hypothetical protein